MTQVEIFQQMDVFSKKWNTAIDPDIIVMRWVRYSYMHRNIELTADGSATIYSVLYRQSYHSMHGALAESMHVYINAGLADYHRRSGNKEIRILEMGFGTGLNALLTLQYAQQQGVTIYYTAIENTPLPLDEVMQLNYAHSEGQAVFEQLHTSPWEAPVALTDHFTLCKINTDFTAFNSNDRFDIIYYDAFSPGVQPGLWTPEVIGKLYHIVAPGGAVVTYCCKGAVWRAFRAAGFYMEKLKGPKGKREMLRAVRK